MTQTQEKQHEPDNPDTVARGDQSDHYDYDDDAIDCANCGGEGFTYGCSWDWQCDTYDEGEGTCLCTRRCEWCNPLTAAELAERKRLQDVLATALAKDKVAEMRTTPNTDPRATRAMKED